MIVGRLRMYLKFLGTTVSSVSGCSPFSGASLCLRKKKKITISLMILLIAMENINQILPHNGIAFPHSQS